MQKAPVVAISWLVPSSDVFASEIEASVPKHSVRSDCYLGSGYRVKLPNEGTFELRASEVLCVHAFELRLRVAHDVCR